MLWPGPLSRGNSKPDMRLYSFWPHDRPLLLPLAMPIAILLHTIAPFNRCGSTPGLYVPLFPEKKFGEHKSGSTPLHAPARPPHASIQFQATRHVHSYLMLLQWNWLLSY